MSGVLDGRIALVTGGGRGIGQAIALAFAAEGAAVSVTGRTAGQLEETVANVQSQGGRAFAVSADVTNQADVERAVAETVATFGPIDILVNNAGYQERGGLMWEVDRKTGIRPSKRMYSGRSW